MTRKFFYISIAILLSPTVFAQKQFTQIFAENIKTLEVKSAKSAYSYPFLDKNNPDDVLTISFDELSHTAKNFAYTTTHCNADWTPSALSRFEYIDGADYEEIENYDFSVNTYIEYTHYWFDFPSERMRPTLSGNYLIQIFDTENPEKILLQARCYVVENLAEIRANVRTNTNVDINARHQQVDFDVYTRTIGISDPMRDIKVTVRQNERTDNEAENLKPTALYPDRLQFINNPKCIFEAGNEYRSLDFSNIYIKDTDVSDMRVIDNMYHVELFDAQPRTERYSFYDDANGRFRINLQRNNYDDNLEADYAWIHFFMPANAPFFEGKMFVFGGFNYNLLNKENEMEYDVRLNGYRTSLLLKQGGYNYMYLYKPKGKTAGTCQAFEGDFWQTKNEYEIFVYYRPPQSRYDRLIGYQLVEF